MAWADAFHVASMQAGQEQWVRDTIFGLMLMVGFIGTLALALYVVYEGLGWARWTNRSSSDRRQSWLYGATVLWTLFTLGWAIAFLVLEVELYTVITSVHRLGQHILSVRAALLYQLNVCQTALAATSTALQGVMALNNTHLLTPTEYVQGMTGLLYGQTLLGGMMATIVSVDVPAIVHTIEDNADMFNLKQRSTLLPLAVLLVIYVLGEAMNRLAILRWKSQACVSRWCTFGLWAVVWLVVWLVTVAVLGATMMTASVCYNPLAVLDTYMNNSLALYYTHCDRLPLLFPYADELARGEGVLHLLQGDTLNASCTALTCTAAEQVATATLQAAVNTLHDAVGMDDTGLVGLVACRPINALYHTTQHYVCDELGWSLAWYSTALLCIAIGLFFSLYFYFRSWEAMTIRVEKKV